MVLYVRWGMSPPQNQLSVCFFRVDRVQLFDYRSSGQQYEKEYVIGQPEMTRTVVRVGGQFCKICLGECLHIRLGGEDFWRGGKDPAEKWQQISRECKNRSTRLVDGYHTSTIEVKEGTTAQNKTGSRAGLGSVKKAMRSGKAATTNRRNRHPTTLLQGGA